MRIVQDEKNKKLKRENVGMNNANVLAIIFASLGVMTIILGDGGTYKGFAVPAFVGWIELGAAAICAILGVRAKQDPYEEKIMICSKCQTVYPPEKTPNNSQCPNCHCSLELLDGFYERHPKLKIAPEKFTPPEKD